jgi:hypothetical protein
MSEVNTAADVHLVLVSDGQPEDQQWVDAFIASAQSGAGDWPHTHPDIPRTSVTVDRLWKAIADNVQFDGVPWSVAEQGYPPFAGTEPAMIVSPPPPGDPNRGSVSHNLLHSILGNFH